MIQHTVPVVENVQLAERTFRLRLADPEVGAAILPGQFVMLRIPGCTDPLLGRPFALWDTYLDPSGRVAGYDLVHLVVGKMTALLSKLVPGDFVEVWGPLGNGFTLAPTRHLMMVGGGIGHTPFPAVARAYIVLRRYGTREEAGAGGRKSEASAPSATQYSVLSTQYSTHGSGTFPAQRSLAERVSLCYGVRSAAYLAGVSEFEPLGVAVSISTDDGSAGHHGFVTDLVKQSLSSSNPPTLLMGCGPEPMMKTLAGIAAAAGVPCELSLETPMACGIGACFSCVAKIRQDDDRWDYRRVCVEGPVFDASRVVF
jgi:dihydroorotate dehydrogenase electron transfer subunit